MIKGTRWHQSWALKRLGEKTSELVMIGLGILTLFNLVQPCFQAILTLFFDLVSLFQACFQP
jgi:hypothetical protein